MAAFCVLIITLTVNSRRMDRVYRCSEHRLLAEWSDVQLRLWWRRFLEEPVRHLASVFPPGLELCEGDCGHKVGEVLGGHVTRVHDTWEWKLKAKVGNEIHVKPGT